MYNDRIVSCSTLISFVVVLDQHAEILPESKGLQEKVGLNVQISSEQLDGTLDLLQQNVFLHFLCLVNSFEMCQKLLHSGPEIFYEVSSFLPLHLLVRMFHEAWLNRFVNAPPEFRMLVRE